MAGICSDLLGISQQEFLFHVHRANQWTVAPFLSLRRSVSSFLGLTPAADLPPLSPVRQCSADLPPLPLVRQCSYPLSSSQLSKGQNGEQNTARSDALALLPSCPSSVPNLRAEEATEHCSVHEQGLCSRGEALPQGVEQEGEGLGFVPGEGRGEAWPQGGEGLFSFSEESRREACPQREEWQGEVLGSSSEGSEGDALSQDEDRIDTESGGQSSAEFERASRATCIADLDEGCLALVMARCDISTLRACSLVCRDLLAASSFARTSMSLQNSPQIAALPRFLARFHNLQTLHITGLPSSPSSSEPKVNLDVQSLGVIARSCINLRELRVKRCDVSDAGLAVVLRGCPELRVLGLAYCGSFTGGAFSGLCCRLERLQLNECWGLTNEGMVAAAAACPKLETLSVCTEQPETSLARGLGGAARFCGGLRALTIHACGIDDETLDCFATSCPLLNNVRISCELLITDGGVASFFGRLHELEAVTLQNNQALTRIPHFGLGRRVKTMKLAWWWTMPDRSFMEIAKESSLEELELSHCSTLTDAAVIEILRGCKGLKRLVLLDNDLVTTEAVKAFLKSGSKARLEVQQCSGVEIEELGEDMSRSERLKVY